MKNSIGVNIKMVHGWIFMGTAEKQRLTTPPYHLHADGELHYGIIRMTLKY